MSNLLCYSSYVCWSGDFELAGAGDEETPLQKYQRLNCEVSKEQSSFINFNDAK